MPRLHELLAIEGPLKAQYDKTRGELTSTFEKKTHLFTEKVVKYIPSGEGEQEVTESQLNLQTDVMKELKWISGFMVKAMDAAYSIAEANTVARADVVLEDGTLLLRNLPPTALLELEKRVTEIRDFVAAIPTLDPAKGFTPAPDRGEGIYRAHDDMKKRTKKVFKVLTLAAATDKHPAQAEKYTEDVPVGDILTMEWSGLITSAAKGDMLARCEDLARAVKTARSRANDFDVKNDAPKIGTALTGFVFGL